MEDKISGYSDPRFSFKRHDECLYVDNTCGGFVISNKISVKLFVNELDFEKWFAEYKNSEKTAFVSPDIPLLSNLTTIDNIALVSRFHTKTSDTVIFEDIKNLMSALEIEDAVCLKPSHLDEKMIFKVKLLRAVMMPDAVIIIDRPFFMIRNMADIQPIKKMLALLDTYFEQCIISDYEWHRSRYGDLIE